MSRSVRLETRSRARDELRRAMKAIDKVKKWEKKWVPVGGSSCKLKVYKWVPKATVEKKAEEGKEDKEVTTTEGEVTATTDNEEVKPEETPEVKERFPTSQFLQNVDQNTNEDSRDSFTASTAELMKYCPDPDSQDSITESDYTVTMSDQLEDSTKPLSESSTPAPNDTSKSNTPDPKITVSDAFKDKEEPTAPSLPEKEPEKEDKSENKEEAAAEEPPAASAPPVEEEKMETEDSSTQNKDVEPEEQTSEIKTGEEPKTEDKPEEEPKEEEKNDEETPPNKKLKEG